MDDFATGYMAGQDSGGGGGGFGNFGEGIWAVIILAILFGRGGLGGFGGFGGGGEGCGCQTAVSNGFALNGLENGIRCLQNGLCDGFYAVNTSMLTGFNGIQSLIASCCCDTQRSIDGLGRNIDSVRYDMATGFCGLGNTINNASRDIIDNQNANYRGIMDFLVGEKLASKDARIVELTNQISQLNQNAVLGARIDAAVAEVLRRTGHECPTAAYLVNAPTPVSFPTNSCGQVQFGGYGCGCGC
jgi:hypothetical protein